MIEKEYEEYLKQDPDPFDDRDPTRLDAVNTFGLLLRALFKRDDFMTKVIL